MGIDPQHDVVAGDGGGVAGTEPKMRAVVQDRFGEAAEVLRLEEISRPQIGAHDVLVRVKTASVHIGDWHVMRGMPHMLRVVGFGFRAPKARVRGMDVAGTVEAVGAAVTEFQVGDAVFGTCEGAFAEYASAREDMLAHKPTNLSFEQAAAVPTSGFAALQALRDTGGIQAGQRVLIIGASGGVGMFAVQITKSFGADVTGVCGPSKAEIVRSLGADHVIDYTREDVTRGGQRYDLVLDLGGNRSLSQLRRVLTPRGTLVLVGGEGGGRLLGGSSRWLPALLMSPFIGPNLRPLSSKPNKEDLQVLKKMIEAGQVTPVIDRTYSLTEVPEAISYLTQGHPRGKIVIAV